MYLRCPHCSNAFELIADLDTDEVTCPSCHTRLSVDEMLSEGYDEMSSVTVSATEVMPKPGEMVGHFRVEKEIGRGGFGSVFRAFDTRLERWVAIKIPRTRRMSRRQAELFMREAQAAAQMHDPNIVTIHEVGRDGDRVYIASELVEGDTLVEWMKAKPRGWREIADVMAIIARAMHRAHERGVIHRDLKPRNIMMDTHDKPRVTDFGLAKREDPAVITVTRRGDVIGTPAYMPPEQASGTADLVDRRGDVYSMGVMLYELVAGKRPFRGETDLLINEVIECRPTLPRSINNNIPADLEAICLKAMAREPNKRFATAGEMADELQRFVAG
ncbi:MAG TPA: protein kinase, partial [Pirellulaceae bacterium]|nr:protein kinase [Pirellulaceae bacterium]